MHALSRKPAWLVERVCMSVFKFIVEFILCLYLLAMVAGFLVGVSP